MDWKLELVILPVTDVDRAKVFYVDRLGFSLDVDHKASETFRVVQVTPPGSACSVTFGVGLGGDVKRGPVTGLHLVVDDIAAAEAHLDAAGVPHDGVVHYADGVPTPGPDPEQRDYQSFLNFADPDGNGWVVQHVRRRGQ
jgi:catechol 2,3-dioxygenase-like lactoylglutathione lyase family enzyme